jgi:hypothetical protein
MTGLKLESIGMPMEPEPGNPHEFERLPDPAARAARMGSCNFLRFLRREVTRITLFIA